MEGAQTRPAALGFRQCLWVTWPDALRVAPGVVAIGGTRVAGGTKEFDHVAPVGGDQAEDNRRCARSRVPIYTCIRFSVFTAMNTETLRGDTTSARPS